MELRLRTFSVFAFALRLRFIGTITTVVSKVTSPLFRDATVVLALEVGVRLANWTVFWKFVAVIAAIVLSIAEQPFGDAAVVGLAWTSLPSSGAVALTAHVGWFVGVIAAIVVKVAHPKFRNATAVLAAELCFWIAGAFV
jgi:hypothetical protein